MQSRQPTEHRQAEMVQAVLTLTEKQSVDAITTSDIAKAVGLSQGAVFRHFPNKQTIWLAVIDWVQQTLLDALDTAARNKHQPLDRLQAMFEAHVDFVMCQPGVPRLLFHELQQPSDSLVKKSVRTLLAAYRRRIVSLLDLAKQTGQTRSDLDTDAAATLFIGTIQGLVMQAMLMGDTKAMRKIAGGLFNIYLDGIRRQT